jgi:Raf kinase inhibitor-like YbhB/YbcL family protein
MKKIFLTILFFALSFVALNINAAEKFTISSTSFEEEKIIPNKFVFKGFGCEGENLSPQISWKNAPEGTKSFAVTIYDPDAPTGSGWWHWGVYNITANINEIAEGASKTSGAKMPEGAQEIFTDFGQTGYGGPCPPVGDKPHRYILTVHALNTEKLELNPNTTTGALLGFMLKDTTLDKASITGVYGR